MFHMPINILDFIFKGMLIGMIASAPMGPVGILCVQRTLNKGRWFGLATGIGAAISDIIYISGMKDYVMFYLECERRPLVTHLTMKSVEDMLPTQQFMRVHRSFIVCLDKIRKVDRNDCIYIGEEIIHVTEAYLPAFQQYLNSKFPGK